MKNINRLMILFSMICLAVILISVFLPYTTATEEYASILRMYSNEYTIPSLNINGKDLVNVSMFEYAKIYIFKKDIFSDYAQGIFYFVLIVLIVVFILCAVLSLKKLKIKRTLVYTVLSLSIFCIQSWDYKDRGVISDLNYKWGIGYYTFIIFGIILLVSLFVYKKTNKINQE